MRVVVESDAGARREFHEDRRGERAVAAPPEFRRAAAGGAKAGGGATGPAGRGGTAGAAGREVDVYGVVDAPPAFSAEEAAPRRATGPRSLPDDVP